MLEGDRGDRGALVALGLLLIAVVLVATITSWSGEPPDQTIGQPHTREVQQSQGNDISQPVVGQRAFDPWADSYAQWLMAIFGVIATGVSVWAVRLVGNTLAVNRAAVAAAIRAAEAAERSADITRDLGQKQIRAYLTCIGGEYTSEPGLVAMKLEFANRGQSPAFNVNTETRVGFYYHDPDFPETDPDWPDPPEPRDLGMFFYVRCTDIAAGRTEVVDVHYFRDHFPQEWWDAHDVHKENPPHVVECDVTWCDVFGDRLRIRVTLVPVWENHMVPKDGVLRSTHQTMLDQD